MAEPADVAAKTVSSVVVPRIARIRQAATATTRPTAAPARTNSMSPSNGW